MGTYLAWVWRFAWFKIQDTVVRILRFIFEIVGLCLELVLSKSIPVLGWLVVRVARGAWYLLLGPLLFLLDIGIFLLPVLRLIWAVLGIPVEFAAFWLFKPFVLLVKWLNVSPVEWLFRGLWALSEAPRRYLSHSILNVMTGFHDSVLELGEESIPPDEEDIIKQTLVLLERRHKRDYPAGVRPMLRDFHGKAHACLAAKFTIEQDLPAEVRYGIFKSGNDYDAVVRFSNGSRSPGSDRLPNQHGMAIKVILEGGLHQDFILSDFPVAFMPDAKNAFAFYLADAADRHFAYFVRHLKSTGILFLCSAFQPQKDLFEAHYFSQTPYRLGPKRACKYIARPAGATSKPPKYTQDDLPVSPNYLRARVEARLRQAELTGPPIRYHFFVQPQRNPIRQPVENASFRWSEREAQPIHVATITLRPSYEIPFTSPEAQWHNELIAFSPELGLPDHAPLGGLNRVRKRVYRLFAEMRFRANGVQERRGTDALPPGGVGPLPSPERATDL